jgi:DNA-directed RNA polymerase specialized sigma24 family protein
MAERLSSTDALGGQLFDRYGQSLFTYCLLMLDSADLAAVAVHDSILVAVSHAEQLSRVPDVRTWLFAIARNECRRARHNTAPSAASGRGGWRPRADDPTAPVWQALARLGWAPRELLLLTAQQGLSYRQLANVLGVPARTARRDTNRAHHRLELTLGAALRIRPGTGRHGMRRQITAALATTPTPAVPTELSRTIRSSCRVPPRVLYFGGRAGRFEPNGFPRPWDRRRFGRVPVGRGVLAGCALALPLAAVAADAADQPPYAPPVHAAPSIPRTEAAVPPSGAPSTSATPKHSPTPSHSPSHHPSSAPPSATTPSAAAPSTAVPSVSATFASNSTLTCGAQWSGTARATVTGAPARSATVVWSANGSTHTVGMTAVGDNTFEADVSGLPSRTTVHWSVRVSTGPATASSTEQTATQSCVL